MPRFRGDRLRSTLRDLKRSGCLILVVGDKARERTRAALTARLFGEGDWDRIRVLAFTSPTTLPVTDWLPAGVEPADGGVALLDWTDGRATAAVAPAAHTVDGPPLEEGDLRRLRADLERTTREVTGDAPLEAGQLRVGVYALDDFLDGHDVVAAKEFVARTWSFSRSANGMVHCHVRFEKNHPVVTKLAEHADIVVELRHRDGRDEHRWHIVGEEEASDWLPLGGEPRNEPRT